MLRKVGHWFAYAALPCATFIFYLWFTKPAPVPVESAVKAAPAPELARVERVVTPVEKVLTYAPVAKAKLKLPEPVVRNDSQQVVASTRIEPAERRTTVTTVLDTKTGESTQYAKAEPTPWVDVESRGSLGLAYGYKWRGFDPAKPVYRLSAQEDLLQIKGLHFGVQGSIDTDGDRFVGAGVRYRW